MVDRLELAELVRRERSTEDRRAISITLTARGTRELAFTRTVLVDWVRSNFADHLAPDELGSLGDILQKLLDYPFLPVSLCCPTSLITPDGS